MKVEEKVESMTNEELKAIANSLSLLHPRLPGAAQDELNRREDKQPKQLAVNIKTRFGSSPEHPIIVPLGDQANRKLSEVSEKDPMLDVSADAKYISGRIIKHLWIIFVLLPVVLGILFAIVNKR